MDGTRGKGASAARRYLHSLFPAVFLVLLESRFNEEMIE